MGKISIQETDNKITISNRLTRTEAINEREMNAIAGGILYGLIPVASEKKKKDTIIKSIVTDMISLQDYFAGIVTKRMFLDAMIQLARLLKGCEDHKMNANNLHLDKRYIFVNPRTKDIYCIFWPIVNNQGVRQPSAFLSELPYELVFKEQEDHAYVTEYIHFFKMVNPFSINAFERLILELLGKKMPNEHAPSGDITSESGKKEYLVSGGNDESKKDTGDIAYDPLKYAGGNTISAHDPSGTTVLGSNCQSSGTTVLGCFKQEEFSYPYLIRNKTQEKVYIDKPSFLIGQARGQVDYCIPDNNAISRVHANIVMKNGQYFIVDKKSTNKTYVDGKIIQAAQEFELFPGTELRLADEDFIFDI